ncbi:HD-like signal output (HDOD) domain, no enzymatic activity [Solimonas aquatica]|uniref:HD-like signal output (HDOD) domain, no enzymatic activity n=1 Tax=Solimonas aquatica TaxID=489703 RepID=A0A1H9CMV2_9GAMM|nr:HDOD domain-containing protein [Solimonas aquatica]SEQ02535.1 HD-like signal output (HDOD) domain, no enzymatic activity [Solimonas aquatica]
MPDFTRFHRLVAEALAADRLVLPSLPEVALHVRELTLRDNVTVPLLAAAVHKDPATAARLIQVANSAAARGGRHVENVRQAITRLGLEMTRLLVCGLAVEQMFKRGSSGMEYRLRYIWEQSLEVAAGAQALAAYQGSLNPEMAMLAGLIHHIGALPILRLAENRPESIRFEADIDDVVDNLGPRIGTMVLRAWHFPAELAQLPELWPQFSRRHEGPADYVDLIQVALLQSRAGNGYPWNEVERIGVPAYDKLGVTPTMDIYKLPGYGGAVAPTASADSAVA